VVLVTRDGKSHEGLYIKSDNTQIIYIDNVTHQAEKLYPNDIRKIAKSNTIYDFEAKPITKVDINKQKRYSRTIGYTIGGFALGTGAGFGVAALLASSGVPLLYPMLAGALGGAYFFGVMGSESDREIAIKEIRDKRFAVSKQRLQKELSETRQIIEKKQKEKEKILKEIEEKKREKDSSKD
jgi:hypothetical protein